MGFALEGSEASDNISTRANTRLGITAHSPVHTVYFPAGAMHNHPAELS